jgi:hypothetical protein
VSIAVQDQRPFLLLGSGYWSSHKNTTTTLVMPSPLFARHHGPRSPPSAHPPISPRNACLPRPKPTISPISVHPTKHPSPNPKPPQKDHIANPPHSYVSPRQRAQRTLELLNVAHLAQLPWPPHGEPYCANAPCHAKIEVTDDIREWDYGDYEGLTSPAIRALRRQQGLDVDGGVRWDIWRDGCPGGE